MFGWLKKWSGKERRAREEQQVVEATERAMVMARATQARREREKKAQAEADQARQRRLDADRAREWEVARRAEEDRHAQARLLLQEMTAQREAHRKPMPTWAAASAPDMPAMRPLDAERGPDEAAILMWAGKGGSMDGGGASNEWRISDKAIAPAPSVTEADSTSGGDSGSGGDGGGGGSD